MTELEAQLSEARAELNRASAVWDGDDFHRETKEQTNARWDASYRVERLERKVLAERVRAVPKSELLRMICDVSVREISPCDDAILDDDALKILVQELDRRLQSQSAHERLAEIAEDVNS